MLASVWCVVGCGGGDGPRRFDVSGKVTHRGQPVAEGMIIFEPDSSKGNSGPQGFAAIKDGQYNTSRRGQGVVGGPHLVRISGFDGVSVSEDSPNGSPLFPTFSLDLDLPKESTIQDFDVPAG